MHSFYTRLEWLASQLVWNMSAGQKSSYFIENIKWLSLNQGSYRACVLTSLYDRLIYNTVVEKWIIWTLVNAGRSCPSFDPCDQIEFAPV